MKHLATIASIFTAIVLVAVAEVADLRSKVRPRAPFAFAWPKL
jgi:hypothetical protein